jgi:hypothetical protein
VIYTFTRFGGVMLLSAGGLLPGTHKRELSAAANIVDCDVAWWYIAGQIRFPIQVQRGELVNLRRCDYWFS